MIGLIASHLFIEEIREVFEKEDIWFEKIGIFTDENFLHHCQSVTKANIQTLIVDMTCTNDESIIRGIQQYRLHKDSRIILIAPEREPGDQVIYTLLGLQVLDILVPVKNQEGYDSIKESLLEIIQTKPSYKNVVSWDIRSSIVADQKKLDEEIKKLEKEKNKISHSNTSIFEHIESTEIHLPKVKEKLLFVDRTIGTILISVLGVEKGVGVTHTGILVANFLTRRGNTVAIVEVNKTNDFSFIEGSYEGEDPSQLNADEYFQLRGVTYYKSNYSFEIAELMEKRYDYIILDLGSYAESNYIDEFYRSHLQIVIGNGSDWKQHEIIDFSLHHKDRDQSKWAYCIPHVKPIVIDDIEKELYEGQLFRIPTHPDPYEIQKDTDSILNEILENLIEKKKYKFNRAITSLFISSLLVIVILIYFLLKK